MEEIFAEEYVSNKRVADRISALRSKKARELQMQKRIIILALAIIVFVIIAFVFVQGVKANTASDKKIKSFSTVEVKSGDTVWSIASKYMTEEYSDVSELVKEIEKTNHISADAITAGSYIIVPYFTASK